MHRIDTSTAQVDKFGSGKNGFTGGNPQTGELPTALDADYFDSIQEEICAVIEASSTNLDKNKRSQLYTALKLLFLQPANALSEINALGSTSKLKAIDNIGVRGAVTGTVGQSRNAKMTVTSPSALADFLADELVVNTALGGNQYRLKNVGARINLTTSGVGGMDTGSTPATGYVAVYVIYNPTNGSVALLGVDATSTLAPEVYGGSNMPSGYTASALVAVWPTASSQFVIGNMFERKIDIATRSILSSSVINPSRVSLSTTAFPLNAKFIHGGLSLSSTAASSVSVTIWGGNGSFGGVSMANTVVANGSYVSSYSKISVSNQTIGWSSGNTAGTPTFGIAMGSYEF